AASRQARLRPDTGPAALGRASETEVVQTRRGATRRGATTAKRSRSLPESNAAQPQAKSQETVKEADPSNAESNRSTTTKTPVAVATDASQSSNKKKLHELVATAPEKLETYRRLRVRKCMGWSKQGMPVFVERIGEFITSLSSDLAKTMTVQDWLDCYMYEMAGLILEFRKGAAQGNVQWKMLFIADMRGVKFMQAFRSINLLKAFAKEVEVHFPEQAGPVFLINTPSVVHSAWKLAKQFLDPVVLAKIQLHPNAATNVLLEHMDEDVLFEEYGGKNRDHFPHAEIH
ncbi:Phosphatidylinositol/phosphatidylcholine transfer protein SFH12, partial [Hondaea fermentalgiana]